MMGQNKEATVDDYLEDDSMSTCARVMHVLTWELQSTINLYGQMNMKLWVYCAVVFVYMTFLPIGFNFDQDDVVSIFSWGIARPTFHSFELATAAVGLFFPNLVVYPTYSLLARWTTAASARKKRRSVTPYEGLLLFLEVGGSVACVVILVYALTLTAGLFASPMFWVIVVNNALLLFELLVPCTCWQGLAEAVPEVP